MCHPTFEEVERLKRNKFLKESAVATLEHSSEDNACYAYLDLPRGLNCLVHMTYPLGWLRPLISGSVEIEKSEKRDYSF